MPAYVSHTTVDCRDAYRLSEWWKRVLGYLDVPGDPNEPGDEECMIVRPDGGHRLLFIEVRERKQGKNRLHLDLRPTEGTRDEELDRLRELGAPRSPTGAVSMAPGPAGWCSPIPTATSSASCAATPNSGRSASSC